MTQLVAELSASINPPLAQRLVQYYVEVRRFFRLGDFVALGVAAGKFAEASLECFLFLYAQRSYPIGVRFADECKWLMNQPKPDIRSEDLALIAPTVANLIYTLRNKRQVAHARGQEIDYLDCRLIVQSCDWVVAELLWLTHRVSDSDALRLMTQLMELDLPLVEIIDDELVISDPEICATDALLAILYRKGGRLLQSEAVKVLGRRYAKSTCYDAVRKAVDKCWAYQTAKGELHLLAAGKAKVENTISEAVKRRTQNTNP